MQIRRSNAFLILKEHSQSTLDFSVLVCTAVPQLRYAFNQHDIDSNSHLVENSEFRNSTDPYSTEKKTMHRYKTVLGANILLSNFSFFESYFFSLIDEIIEFHGGKDDYLSFIERKIKRTINLTEDEEKNLKKLRKKHNNKHIDRYKKYTRLLNSESIIWPSEKLAYQKINFIIYEMTGIKLHTEKG